MKARWHPTVPTGAVGPVRPAHRARPRLPTLCAGWRSADLAAHLLTRERRPDTALGMATTTWNRSRPWTTRVRHGARDTETWDTLVSRCAPAHRPYCGPWTRPSTRSSTSSTTRISAGDSRTGNRATSRPLMRPSSGAASAVCEVCPPPGRGTAGSARSGAAGPVKKGRPDREGPGRRSRPVAAGPQGGGPGGGRPPNPG